MRYRCSRLDVPRALSHGRPRNFVDLLWHSSLIGELCTWITLARVDTQDGTNAQVVVLFLVTLLPNQVLWGPLHKLFIGNVCFVIAIHTQTTN